MRHHRTHSRSGITLTEILIAIMIMGIGMVSVATLFPIGLLRMREATRDSRSTILAQSAAADASIRGLPYANGLLNPESFLDRRLPWYGTWRQLNTAGFPFTITPMSHDLDTITGNLTTGVFAEFFAPGLPVAYDPLFWATTHYNTDGLAVLQTPTGLRGTFGSEGRFGSGIGYVRDAGGPPAAHGLQRITNFQEYDPALVWPFTYTTPTVEATVIPALLGFADVAGKVFASLDDPVLTDDESGDSGSPVVPVDFDPGPAYSSQRTWDFTWMITGQLGIAGDPSVFEGNVVVFHRRPIGLDPTPDAFGNGDTHLVATGERTIEAIWGYTSNPLAISPIPFPVRADLGGYSNSDDRTVLLRWPRSMPDPLIRVGDFIADVTYERYRSQTTTAGSHYPPNSPGSGQNGAQHPPHRVHWYRIVQRGDVEVDVSPNLPVAHNRVIVRVDTPLKAKTRLIDSGGNVVSPVPEAALICPYVVNVFPIILNSR